MGKRKNRENEEPFCTELGTLFQHQADQTRLNKLRFDLYSTICKQQKIITLIRNEIPNSKDSDARNLLQELTDRLQDRASKSEELVFGFTDRKVDSYRKARLNKQ